MSPLVLHDFHASRGAVFHELEGSAAVLSYGSASQKCEEYEALNIRAGLVDFSFRSRVCVLGADREKFLHGQVTNDILRLKTGQACYAALVTAKGKMESDLYVFKLKDELLLDFEPGLTARVIERLQRFVIAEDVQVVDVSPHYGLLSVSGPRAREVLERSSLNLCIPGLALNWESIGTEGGEIYVANNPRFGIEGYDLFVPSGELEQVALALDRAGSEIGARWVGLAAIETVRIENGVPRYGVDMNESTLPQEAELQERAISFSKGCYIGQEVIARIRTYGKVNKALRRLRLPPDMPLPEAGSKILAEGREVGWMTGATYSPRFKSGIALGYVRKEVNAPGTVLQIGAGGGFNAEIMPLRSDKLSLVEE